MGEEITTAMKMGIGDNKRIEHTLPAGKFLMSAGIRTPPANFRKILRNPDKAAIFCHMHFSRHISLLHSISSLLAALKLRVAR